MPPAVGAFVAAAVLAGILPAAEIVPVVADLPQAGMLAAAPSGSAVACLDEATGAIRLIELRAPPTHRIAVSAPATAGPRPMAVAFIDESVLAAVCRSATGWSLDTWRLRMDGSQEASAVLQRVPLDAALPAGSSGAADVHLVVGRSGGWLAVVGLEPPVLIAAIGGVRVGPLTARHAPRLPAAARPVAAAAGPDDELVVSLTAAGRDSDRIAYYARDGRCLLDLDTGLRGIRDVAFTPDGTRLYAVGGTAADADRPPGLWRLDAAARESRQVISPTLVAPVAEPLFVVGPTPRTILVTQAAGPRRIVEIDPEDTPEERP